MGYHYERMHLILVSLLDGIHYYLLLIEQNESYVYGWSVYMLGISCYDDVDADEDRNNKVYRLYYCIVGTMAPPSILHLCLVWKHWADRMAWPPYLYLSRLACPSWSTILSPLYYNGLYLS